MAITNASRLADFGSGIGTAGAVLEVDYANRRIGLGTTNPNTTVQVGAVGASGTSLFVHGDSRILGVLTATSFSGTVQGSDVSGGVSFATTSTIPGISTQGHTVLGTINAAGIATFAGNVSIAGTLTYDDVTNIDSVGIVTAGKGFRATTGGIHVVAGVSTLGGGSSMADNVSSYWGTGADLQIFSDGDNGVLKGHNGRIYLQSDSGINLTRLGNAETFGVFHANSGVDLYHDNSKKFSTVGTGVSVYGGISAAGMLAENINIVADKLSVAPNIDVANGMAHLFTTAETATSTPNIRYDGSTTLASKMEIGDTITVTVITTTTSASYYSAQMTIDGAAQTEEWLGGSAPSAGSASGYDVYTYNIIKTAAAPTYVVLANFSNFA